MSDISQQLQQQVNDAIAQKLPLNIIGNNSKPFLGNKRMGELLSVADHRGITGYTATELVITARAGTTLKEIEQTLGENNQMLAFEPPYYGQNATIGGTIACNLSGPRRAYCGAARDFVLGTTIINGKGERLKFGGEVMKNVAGYDVSRTMAGAHGTLGILLDISLKVLPRPTSEITLVQETDVSDAIIRMNKWAGQSLPVSASAYIDGQLYIRLSGAASTIASARQRLGGEAVNDTHTFWRNIREQEHPFFDSNQNLWRLSLPSTCKPLSLSGKWLIEWSGSLRWLLSDEKPETIFSAATQNGGSAQLFRSEQQLDEKFQLLDANLHTIHERLKLAFDPHRILNRGRMYKDI